MRQPPTNTISTSATGSQSSRRWRPVSSRFRELRSSVRLTISAAPRWRVFDLSTAQEVFNKTGKVDSVDIAAENGVSVEELQRSIERGAPRRSRGGERSRRGGGDRRRHQRRPGLLQHRPAGVCRDLSVRRRLFDLQHLLDHSCPEHPGVRPVAGTRRQRQAGNGRGVPGGSGHRHTGVGPGIAAGFGIALGLQAFWGLRHRPAVGRPGVPTPDRLRRGGPGHSR